MQTTASGKFFWVAANTLLQSFSKKSLSHGMQQSSDPTVETHRISSFFRDRKTTWPMFQGHGPCKPLRSILYPTVVSSKMQARLS